MADRELRVRLLGDTRSLDRALGRTETKLSAFGNTAMRTTGALKSLAGLGGLALGGGLVAGLEAASHAAA